MKSNEDIIRDRIESSWKQRVHRLTKQIDKLVYQMLHSTDYNDLILKNKPDEKRKV